MTHLDLIPRRTLYVLCTTPLDLRLISQKTTLLLFLFRASQIALKSHAGVRSPSGLLETFDIKWYPFPWNQIWKSWVVDG
jgi:hypothetical protein